MIDGRKLNIKSMIRSLASRALSEIAVPVSDVRSEYEAHGITKRAP